MDNNRKIAKWAGWEREDEMGVWYSVPSMGRKESPPLVDEMRYLWDSVLFPLIKERNVQMDFMIELANETGIEMRGWGVDLLTGAWELVIAAPSQLAEALMRVIDEEEDAQETD